MKTLMLTALVGSAAGATSGFWSGNLYENLGYVAIFLGMLCVLVAALITLRALRTMVRVTMPDIEREEKAARLAQKAERKANRKAFWNKWLGLRPISEEDDLVIDHEYDGIKELDNPVPVWFNGLFYSSVAFGVVYLLIYQVFGIGLNQEQEYDREMAIAERQRQEWLATAANNVDESTVVVDLSAPTISAGASIFAANCAVCHGNAGEGGIGPNLVDNYWLHGGSISDIFKVVKYGVLDKGMVPWEQSLTPAQIAEVSNFILSLQGTNPPNQKEPQGVEYIPEEVSVADSTALSAASL
jgi:cytochrome c oxidase cbb3-type subunit 3